MFQTFLAEFAAAWNVFVRIPLPAFLLGEGDGSDLPAVDGHSALLRVMMPLVGFLLGLMAALPFWVLNLLPSGRMIAVLVGCSLIPLALDLATSWRSLLALTAFIDLRRNGASLETALGTDPGSIDDSRSGGTLIVMLTLHLAHMILCAILACFAPFWFVIALTGAWLVRAELARLNAPGSRGSWINVPRGWRATHWYVAAFAMLAAGFLHPLGIVLAYLSAWALAHLAKNYCLDSIGGVNRQALEIFGGAAELLLMLLGLLLYAGA
ncbi:MAG: hypothetical protein J5806_15215 [Lentisphaeria bacterium]|nr:hypothetical protein [Lentisphaeria bacterium]